MLEEVGKHRAFDGEKRRLVAAGTDSRPLIRELCMLEARRDPTAGWTELWESLAPLPFEEDIADGARWIAKALARVPAEAQGRCGALGFKLHEHETDGWGLEFCWATSDDAMNGDDISPLLDTDEMGYPLFGEEWSSKVMGSLWEDWNRGGDQKPPGQGASVSRGIRRVDLCEAHAQMVVARAAQELPRGLWLADRTFRTIHLGVTGWMWLVGAITRQDGFKAYPEHGVTTTEWLDGIRRIQSQAPPPPPRG